jgi:hypothetical protein
MRSLLRLVVDHNPFYVLSALCMLGGCLTLTNTLTFSPINLGKLLALVVTLNAYELLLVALGLFLIARRGVRRDGMFLLLIEAMFLVDMAFLNAEVYSVSPGVGLAVNVAVYALAVVKLVAIFRVLRFPLDDGLLAFTLAQLLVLFAIPGVFAKSALGQDGRVSPWMMYAAWWAAGLMPVLYVLAVRPRDLITARVGDVARDVLSKVLLVAPLVSLVAHLGTSHWVYKLDFTLANVSPMLLGLAVAIGHHDGRSATYGRRARAQLLLPALAVLLSTGYSAGLMYAATGPDWSPLRIALLVAGLVYVDGFREHRQSVFVYATGLCAVGFGMGPSVGDIGTTATVAARRTESLLERLTPRSPQAWGVVSVVASFLLLGVGFVLSLLRPVIIAITTVPAGEKMGDDTVAGA